MTCRYKKASVVKGHHIYIAVRTPVIGEELHAKPEDNKHDEHAVALILGGRTVGHLSRTISLVLWFFLRLLPRLEALFQQCKTSAYKSPSHLCGYMKIPATPSLRLPSVCWRPRVLCGHPACINPLIPNLKLVSIS